VFAANLCASERDPPPVSPDQAEIVIDRLLETKGDIVNRWLPVEQAASGALSGRMTIP
jgi:hypothetical protein